jgi:transcriptional regulator with XRE-family HTH domain
MDTIHDELAAKLPVQINNNQARLRLVKSDDLDLCSSCNLTAASPLGSAVRPVSISLTEEGVSPTESPISANVIPLLRRSVMRDAQDITMSRNIRQPVEISQRLPVTEFRENTPMPKPPGMPGPESTVGARVRFWRVYRKMSRATLCKATGYSSSGLSDLELGRSGGSERLHLIAAALKLNPHYLEDGRGEPEVGYPQDPPPEPEEWPFPAVSRAKIKKYTKIQRSYLETQLIQAMNEVEAERRNKPS